MFVKNKLKFKMLFMKSKFSLDNPKIFFKMIDKNEMLKVLSDWTYREKTIIFDSFFSENNILVEGIRDRELIDIILREYFRNEYCDIHDCSGKSAMMKINKKLMEFDINDNFILFDKDLPGKLDNLNYNTYYYCFPIDIETSLKMPKDEKSKTSEITSKEIDRQKSNKDLLNLTESLNKYFNRSM